MVTEAIWLLSPRNHAPQLLCFWRTTKILFGKHQRWTPVQPPFGAMWALTLLALTSLTWDIFPSIALKPHLVYLPSPNLTLTCGLTLWLNLRPTSSTQISRMIWTPGWCWLLRTYPTLLPGAPWVWELPAMPGARKLCGCMSEYVTIREDQAGLPGV